MANEYFPGAVLDLIPNRDRIASRVDLMTLHTAVTNTQDLYGSHRGQGGTYAHFYNPKDSPLRQHQEIGRLGRADYYGNPWTLSIEHWDGYPKGAPGYWRNNSDVPPFTESQIENDAQLFAFLVKHHGLENRIATPGRVRGLGWHRLGCSGNFGAYDPSNRRTWSSKVTGVNFSPNFGKVCPGDRRIDQVPEIYDRAQFVLAEKYEIISPRYLQFVPPTQEKEPKDMNYMILNRAVKRSTGQTVQLYALFAPGFWLEFTGVWTANKLAEIHGIKEILTCTESFWNSCKTAAGGK